MHSKTKAAIEIKSWNNEKIRRKNDHNMIGKMCFLTRTHFGNTVRNSNPCNRHESNSDD